MTLVKAVVETVNSSGVVTERRDEKIHNSKVTRYGSRTVDTGQFTFDTKVSINQNSNVKYIQDIVSTDLLAGIWNFQLSTLDEGGYNHDGTDLAETRFVNPNGIGNTGKFQAQYILAFDRANSTDWYEIPDDAARLDMTKQFDLYVWCQFDSALDDTGYGTGDKAIIFSKYHPNGGIEVGFEHQVSGDKYLFVRTLDSVGSPVERTGSQIGFGNRVPKLIRVKRDENNLVSCYVDGVLELSFTEDFDYGIGEDIRIGAHQHPSANQDLWGGHIMQLRLYTGGYLTDSEAERIRIASPQPLTMKLAGKVWKIDDNTNPKTVHVKSFGKSLIETNMTSNILSGTDTTPNRTANVYDAGDDHFEIIDDMFENVDSSFVVKEPGSAANATWSGKFVATGGLVQCTDLLLLKTSGILVITPRKIVIIEDKDGITTPYKFEQGSSGTTPGFIVTHTGKDDSVTINEVELVGRLRLKHKIQSFTTSANPETETLTERPINLRISVSGVVKEEDTDYDVDYESKEITFTHAAATFDVEYDFEDLTTASNTRLYFLNTTTGSASVTEIGKYSKRIFVPQLTHKEDLDQTSQRIILRNNSVLQNYQVLAPFHLNHIRENMKILLVNSIKSVNTTQNIQSITYEYPKMRTIVQLGQHRFDSFDLENINSKDLQSAVASTMKTHNA